MRLSWQQKLTVEYCLLWQERTGLDPNSNTGRVKVTNKPGTASALEVYGLRRWFGSFQAVKNSWFSVEEGSLFCLLGPNGAGKSTTINCLTGAPLPHCSTRTR